MILPMTIPLDVSGLNFRAEPRLGWPARTFYSVKQLKIAFRPASGQFFFAGFKISAHARLVSFVGGPGVGRARVGSGRAQNAQVYQLVPGSLPDASRVF
jgi:hypothetical protein